MTTTQTIPAGNLKTGDRIHSRNHTGPVVETITEVWTNTCDVSRWWPTGIEVNWTTTSHPEGTCTMQPETNTVEVDR